MGRPRAGPAGGRTRWHLGFGPPPRVALLRPAVLWMAPALLSEVSLSRVGGRGQDLAAASEGHQGEERRPLCVPRLTHPHLVLHTEPLGSRLGPRPPGGVLCSCRGHPFPLLLPRPREAQPRAWS